MERMIKENIGPGKGSAGENDKKETEADARVKDRE